MNTTTATPTQYGMPPTGGKPKRSKLKTAVIVMIVIVACAIAAAAAFLAYASKTYDVPLDNTQVFNDLNSLGFSSVRYGDDAVTPTDGFHLVSTAIGRQEPVVDASMGLIDHITHEGATKKVHVDITIENGYYSVVIPSTVLYRFQRGSWAVQNFTDAGAMVTPTRGLDAGKLTWDMLQGALTAAYPNASSYYQRPTFTYEDKQGATGGVVNVSLDQAVTGSLQNYAANAVFNTSFVDGSWKLECLSLSSDYADPRYDAAMGEWRGTWQSTSSSSGAGCSKAQGTTPVLTVLSYDPANNSLQATLSFSEHQHGMRRAENTAAQSYSIYSVDSDSWVNAMPFQNLTLQSSSLFTGSYSPVSSRGAMVSVSGSLLGDGTGTIEIRSNFAVDSSLNVYDSLYSSQGTYTAAAPSYSDFYKLERVA